MFRNTRLRTVSSVYMLPKELDSILKARRAWPCPSNTGKLPSAAYFRLVNMGEETLTLTAVSTHAYARAMLHATTTAQGMSHMRHVQRVTVPAQDHVDFAPGGYHVMLEQAARKIVVGDAIPMTFTFAQGAPVQADCTVRAAHAVPSEPRRHHQH